MAQPASAKKNRNTRTGKKPAVKAAGKTSGKNNAPEDVMDIAVGMDLARNAYSRERHVFLLKVIVVLGALLFLSLSGNLYLGARGPGVVYFSVDPAGKTRPLVALDRPVQPTNVVLNWATNAVTEAMTFSFANYEKVWSKARVNFTSAGWKSFRASMTKEGTLDRVVSNKYVTTATPTGAPVVVAEGNVNGRYAWKIEVPVLITYESANNRQSQQVLMQVVVQQLPDSESPGGLGIRQIVAK